MLTGKMRQSIVSTLAIAGLTVSAASAAPIRVVAAENFYGDVVAQIGGSQVSVTSILANPDQDPHLFEISASVARRIADAQLVVFNGADYDPWMDRLLAASPTSTRQVIEVARLVNNKAGDNPHIWYNPETMPALAMRVAEVLSRLDPAHRTAYADREAAFKQSMRGLTDRIAELRRKYAGTVVTATEPVFGYMADALGLEMRNLRFQRAIMNGTEPSAADVAAFERGLRAGAVRVLLYNSQTQEGLAKRMRSIATEAGVPVVGVTETQPAGKRYQEWMISELNALEQALAKR